MKPAHIYYIYKFRIKKCGLFYIGVTTDIDRRKSSHWSKINVSLYLFNKPHVRSIKDIPAYDIISESLFKLGISNVGFSYIKSICIFKVLDIKDTWEDARDAEMSLLKKYKNHPKLLNANLYSSYKHTP